MKKNILLLSLLSILLIPISVSAQTGIVPCTDNCTLTDFITMIGNIYNFIVFSIATPLAVIAIIIGGVLIMTSAGDPNRMSVGKKVFW